MNGCRKASRCRLFICRRLGVRGWGEAGRGERFGVEEPVVKYRFRGLSAIGGGESDSPDSLRPDPRILSFYDPQDHVCEEYRLLGKNILHTFATTPDVDMTVGKVVALSSSARGEGKTLTSVNLAMTMAQDLCDRVILLDGDLRHPKVHRYLGVAGSSNFNDVLMAEDPNAILDDCIVRTESGLHLLMSAPCGRNPAQLIDSDNMTRLLDILRKRYSLIILDTPPVLLATDALTVGTRSDGMLFLLRARKTQREQIQEARQRIARLEIRMLGYVINNVRSFLPQIWRKYYYGNY
jgi:capsular exopolysaccharide synthesis family protein